MDEFSNARREFEEFFDNAQRLSLTPVNVADELDDTSLDDHVWARVSFLAEGADVEAVRRLSPDVRSYYLTRLFEWLIASDGPDAFAEINEVLLSQIPGAYRHLGLADAADVAERFLGAAPAKRLIADPEADLSDGERDELLALIEDLGTNDAERVAFVRSHADSFSI